MENKKKFYYGWVVVFACFLINFVNTGLLVYTFSLFVLPVSTALAKSPTQIVLAASLFTAAFAIISPMIGKQLEKGRIKQLLIAGAILNGGGFMLLSKVNTLSMFYICYTIVGVGAAIVGPAVHSTLPAYWFEKKRGLAVGIANVGAGAGSIIAPMVITATMTSYDWRMGFFVLGAISAVILCALVFIIKTKPSEIGLYPDGLTKEEFDAQPAAERPVLEGLTRPQAFKTSAFWMICISFLFIGVAQLGVLQNQAAFLIGIQFDMSVAARALAYIGSMSILSKFIFGWLADKFHYKLVFLFGNILLVSGIIMLANVTSESNFVYMAVYAILFGLGIGSWYPIAGVIVGKTFGVKFYAAIYGFIFSIRAIGDIFGAPSISAIAGTRGYSFGFLCAAACACVSVVLIMLIQTPKAYTDLIKK
ncbi:Sugar phosphate permease [Dethiosulfatibacter aminovorans DSM 17477]|uniref:Sugar phosphate permease n=1 Tax=Dethiosulfatibacter aminovorans DSM 17477 TaxID=1121476 RepID=A0A1M6EYE8_9FIRM|nr:MFS transporter [Dethiosulfatibacter aminovorans]SHI90498.1 Sugar phosphate permease [Dethiosulfatibacter aminovorans DSM 17477]